MAMRVGLTLVLVLVATVVLPRNLLGLKILFLLLSLDNTGLMTGVKVFPGRPNDTRPRLFVGLTASSSSSSSSSLSSLSPSSSLSSGVSVKSLSRSSKLLVGEIVLLVTGVAIVETEMTSTSCSPD